jgi:hypothetical protein
MRCGGLAVAALLMLPVSAHADVNVTISKSQQRMAVSVDGGPAYVWPVSTGRSGYDTPSGNFSAIRLERVYYSKKYDDAPMPNSVFFHGGYAIHGTLEERRLGNAVSHGCVRLSREHAALLYAEVQAHGMSRTHIRITDGPIYGAAPVVARGGEDNRRYRRADRGVEADDEPLPPRYAQGYQPGRVESRVPRYRGFEEFAEPRYRGEPQRRVYWNAPPPRRYYDDGRGRIYGEAEMRRLYRDNGWQDY